MDRIRLERIEIRNFKNVRHGAIDLSKGHDEVHPCSVLGLYGQNGSGKTAMIDALQILKHLLSPFSACQAEEVREWVHYINVESDSSELSWLFSIVDGQDMEHLVEYAVTLGKGDDEIVAPGGAKGARFTCERISVTTVERGEKGRKVTLVDTGTDEVFKPIAKFRSMVSADKTVKEDLIVAKRLALEKSRSFVFSNEFMSALAKTAVEGNKLLLGLVERMRYYGQYELFVIRTSSTGLISLNALPISFTYEQSQCKSTGSMLLPLNGDVLLPRRAFDTAQVLIQHMNVVLCQLVPGLTIALKDIGSQLMSDGSTGVRVEFVSLKNAREIPLKYESEGIKKIISVLHLLIEVYNKPSTTVAIDELDSGVFEYLLGELLQIIADRGCGQLIFTSHNLRPLEMLSRDLIAFTTTNPDNRYIRFRNVKANNNLRDFYYRDIVLGGQAEEVYSRTNNSDISYAFMAAGEMMSGSTKEGCDAS